MPFAGAVEDVPGDWDGEYDDFIVSGSAGLLNQYVAQIQTFRNLRHFALALIWICLWLPVVSTTPSVYQRFLFTALLLLWLIAMRSAIVYLALRHRFGSPGLVEMDSLALCALVGILAPRFQPTNEQLRGFVAARLDICYLLVHTLVQRGHIQPLSRRELAAFITLRVAALWSRKTRDHLNHVIIKMAKRLATAPVESQKATKSVKLTTTAPEAGHGAVSGSIPLDFAAELDPDWRKQVTQAVAAALPADSAQPIVLVLQDSDVDDTVRYAYNPASQEVGEWLLQALELSSWRNPSLHYDLTAIIHNDDDDHVDIDVPSLLANYLDGRVKQRSDLGRFRVLLTPDEDAPDEDHPELFVNSAKLNFALYHQTCHYDHTFSGGESNDDDSDSDSDSDSS